MKFKVIKLYLVTLTKWTYERFRTETISQLESLAIQQRVFWTREQLNLPKVDTIYPTPSV